MSDPKQTVEEREMGQRLATLCRMTQEMLDGMTSAERDRMMQEHLASALSPERKLQLLCDMTQTLLVLRKQTPTKGDRDAD